MSRNRDAREGPEGRAPVPIAESACFTRDPFGRAEDLARHFLLARPENRMSFYAIAEQFLAKHLGGRAEPIGDDLKGSSVAVPDGADAIPGLSTAER